MLSACLAALDRLVRGDAGVGRRDLALISALEDELGLLLVRDDGSPTEQAIQLARAGRTVLQALDGFFARAERSARPPGLADVVPLLRPSRRPTDRRLSSRQAT